MLDRLYLEIGVTEHAPVFMLVSLVVLDETHHVGGIAEDVVDLVDIHALHVIDGLGRVLLHGVLLGPVGHIVGALGRDDDDAVGGLSAID